MRITCVTPHFIIKVSKNKIKQKSKNYFRIVINVNVVINLK